MSEVITTLQLAYRFRNPDLLEEALTHCSLGGVNNERLEYLGDAILGFLIAEILFTRFPRHDEGALTRMRSSLVKRETLAGVAREVGVGPHIRLGIGERKSGGWRRDSILANSIEAIIGAVYLDSNMEACRDFITHLYAGRLASLTPEPPAKDPKTRLQEFLQARGRQLPTYEVINEFGEAHNREFVVNCLIKGVYAEFKASGRSKREAEQSAASYALQALESELDD